MAVTDVIETDTTLDGADIGVVVVYFVLVIAVGLFVSDDHDGSTSSFYFRFSRFFSFAV